MTRSGLSVPVLVILATACGGYGELAPPAPTRAGEADAAPAAEAADQEAATPDREAAALGASPGELAARVATIEIEPAAIEVQRGDSVTFRGILRDADGNPVEGALWGVSTVGPFELRSIKDEVPDTYVLRGTEYGEAVVGVFLGLPGPGDGQPNWTPAAEIPVKVNDYPVARIDIDPPAYAGYAGTSFALTGRAITTAGEEHAEAVVEWSSADEAVATVTADGRLQLLRPGAVGIVGEAGGVRGDLTLDVVDNPVARMSVSAPESRVRTGDVVRLAVAAMDAAGEPVNDVALAYQVEREDAAEAAATAYMDGAFVADEPGRYRVRVDVGTTAEAVDIEVFLREGRREVTLVGQGPLGTSTSDLWVFEGLDGRDYAYSGTMSAATMYAWDVTDPSAPVIVDSVKVDGRRVNDVKINDDRTIAIVTSENASNRRNGITLIDISNPADPQTITHYTDGLTGGNPQRLVRGRPGIRDQRRYPRRPHHRHLRPRQPLRSRTLGARQAEQVSARRERGPTGIAYLSYWNDGLVMLDVGVRTAGAELRPNPGRSPRTATSTDINGASLRQHAPRHPLRRLRVPGRRDLRMPGVRRPAWLTCTWWTVSDIENPARSRRIHGCPRPEATTSG